MMKKSAHYFRLKRCLENDRDIKYIWTFLYPAFPETEKKVTDSKLPMKKADSKISTEIPSSKQRGFMPYMQKTEVAKEWF